MTHGVKEEADQIRTELYQPDEPVPSPEMPQVGSVKLNFSFISITQVGRMLARASLLHPPVPIQTQETNWPLLTISRGYFDLAAARGMFIFK